MELKDLVGKHMFSGVEYGNEEFREYVIFILDKIKYMALEDPDDGYRSCCESIEITKKKINNQFEPVEVICKMMEGSSWNDVLEIYDTHTAKLIMSIGTEDYNDYYPCFNFSYNPENMIMNQKQ